MLLNLVPFWLRGREEEESIGPIGAKGCPKQELGWESGLGFVPDWVTNRSQALCCLREESGHWNRSVCSFCLHTVAGERALVQLGPEFPIQKRRKLTRFISKISFNSDFSVFIDTLKSLQDKSSLRDQNRTGCLGHILYRKGLPQTTAPGSTKQQISFPLGSQTRMNVSKSILCWACCTNTVQGYDRLFPAHGTDAGAARGSGCTGLEHERKKTSVLGV